MRLVLLGYGPVGDLVAMRRDRIARDVPARALEDIRRNRRDDELAQFRPYARMLAGRYGPSSHAKKDAADLDDLEQIAMVEAWHRIGVFARSRITGADGRCVSLDAYVRARMRWVVLHAIEPQNLGEVADVSRAAFDDSRDQSNPQPEG